MKIWPIEAQQTEQWFRARAGRPTASQFSRIITPKGNRSSQWEAFAVELVSECIRPDMMSLEDKGFKGNRHTDRGNELEPEARELFERIMGVEVKEIGFCTRDDEVVGCSPDGLIYGPDGELIAGLEIKSPLAKNHAAYIMSNELPSNYMQQVHGSMAVTGLEYWYFMSYCPRFRPFIIRVERDEYTEKVSQALDDFLIYYAGVRKALIPKLTAA